MLENLSILSITLLDNSDSLPNQCLLNELKNKILF